MISNKNENNGMDKVTLLDKYLIHANQKDIDYLLGLSADRFLFEFYRVAGLDPEQYSEYSVGYAGWEGTWETVGNNFRGHFVGHYLSALSQGYLGSNNSEIREKLMVKMETAVTGLALCQDTYAMNHSESAGYLSAFSEISLDLIETTGELYEGTLVPYYNLHKILAGLIDIGRNVGGKISTDAINIAMKFGDYMYRRTSNWTNAVREKMLITEYGGMNDVFYDLYDMTGNPNYKVVAESFDETSLFESLVMDENVLSSKHANTMIPKFLGAMKRYIVLSKEDYYSELTQEEKEKLPMYLKAVENFWTKVNRYHTYVTGDHGQGEHFRGENSLAEYLSNVNCETCNAHNMLKLTRGLFCITKEIKYADFYETAYLNSVVASQNPETGMMMYFQPMAPGYAKVYNTPEESFWCCTGTGIESFTKLEDSIYFLLDDTIYVNMYFSSEYSDGIVNLKQEVNLPNEDVVKFTIGTIGDKVLRLRYPNWAAENATVKLNGTVISASVENGYITLENLQNGDALELIFPMEVVIYDTPDDPNYVAFKYGPAVLAARLGEEDVDAVVGAGIMVYASAYRETTKMLILDNTTVTEWKDNVAENLVRIEDNKETGDVQFKLKETDQDDTLIYTPYYSLHDERYGIYMYLAELDSEILQQKILRDRRERRDEAVRQAYLTDFDSNNQKEKEYNLQYYNSGTGEYNNKNYRDAGYNGWFSYDFPITQGEINYLSTTYTISDSGRHFELFINNELFVNETITNDGIVDGIQFTVSDSGFYTVRREIPSLHTQSSNLINVRFQGTGESYVGGLYGVSIGEDYNSNPKLQKLEFNTGILEPSFNGSITEYTLTVVAGTPQIEFTVGASNVGALVYINGILFDDTQTRQVKLEDNTADIILLSKAQDHITEKTYYIYIGTDS